jgi:hypothetical protein
MSQRREMRMLRIVLLILMVVMFCTSGYGRTIHVDQNDLAAFATIQAAIDDANDGDTVLVAGGTYRGDGNRDIDFRGKAIAVKSEAGPRTCIIACQGSWDDSHRGFYFHSGEDGDSVLDGFTITGGVVGEFGGGGGGICCYGSSPSIRHCMVVGNVAGAGAGIALGQSDAVISNCIVAGNRARLWSGRGGCVGGGLSCAQGRPIIRNCTICGNQAYGNGGGVTATDQRTTLLLVNCILVSNKGSVGTQLFSGGCTMIIGCPEIQIINCCLEDEPDAVFVENWSDPRRLSESCIQLDPLFAQPGHWYFDSTPGDSWGYVWVEGDYHLKSQAGRWDPVNGTWVKDEVTSPCIDAGDPNSPVRAEPFLNGGRINMGAYGGTAEASKSPSGLHAPYGAGAREPNDPYLIYTAEQFKAIGANPDDWDRHFAGEAANGMADTW